MTISQPFDPFVRNMKTKLYELTSAMALRVAHYLTEIRRFSDATVRVSHARIAKALNASAEGVRKGLNILRDAGLITWTTEHRHACVYKLLFVCSTGGQQTPAKDTELPNTGGEANTSYPTQGGTSYPTQGGTILNGISSKITTPPTPREPEPEPTVTSSKREGGEIQKSRETTASPVSPPSPAGERPASMSYWQAEDLAKELVPPVTSFSELGEVITRTVNSNADGQEVTDWDLHRQVEGRSHAGIPAEVLPDVVRLLIRPLSAETVPVRVAARFTDSVAAMGRWGEVTPKMINGAVDMMADGRTAVDAAARIHRQIMANRYSWRRNRYTLLQATDGGARPAGGLFDSRYRGLADLVPGRDVPVGERVVSDEQAMVSA